MSISESHTRYRLDAASNGMVMPPEDFDLIKDFDDEFCYELVNGVVIVNSIPSEAESDPNDELGFLLRDYQRNHPQGSVLDRTMPERYVHTRTGRRRADRVIWVGLGRVPDAQEDTPAIAIEFVSQSKRDRSRDYQEKTKEYREAGVQEYWGIDRFKRIVRVYHRDHREQVIAEGDVYRTDLLPGFELPLARLFSIADNWQ